MQSWGFTYKTCYKFPNDFLTIFLKILVRFSTVFLSLYNLVIRKFFATFLKAMKTSDFFCSICSACALVIRNVLMFYRNNETASTLAGLHHKRWNISKRISILFGSSRSKFFASLAVIPQFHITYSSRTLAKTSPWSEANQRHVHHVSLRPWISGKFLYTDVRKLWENDVSYRAT